MSCDYGVAPHVGAWIEMSCYWNIPNLPRVAPHVGAWIEIPYGQPPDDLLHVAPHVGAWIEIRPRRPPPPSPASHPTWVRGLKSRRDDQGHG